MTTTFKIQETNTELCIVGLPKHTYTCFLSGSDFIIRRAYEFHQEQDDIKLPNEGFELLSLYSELTEEKLEGLMPSELSVLETEVYRNYKEDTYRKYYSLSSALESFNSLMTKLECYTVNPYGGKPNERDMLDFELVSCFEEAIYIWTEAQQRTHEDYAILIRKIG